MRLFLTLLLLVIFGCATAPQKQGKMISAWIELGADSTQIVRVLTSKETCPTVMTDQNPLPLQRRVGPPDWPVLVCEGALPLTVKKASVENQNLNVLKDHIKKILVIGDTGCRVRDGLTNPQACNDPHDWPFALVSGSGAAWQPDLVIHVGDYHYREGNCAPGNAGCAGTIAGDNWESWNQDFVVPSAKLLTAAPWIMVRGNHELCNRGGTGWFAMFETRPYQKCTDKLLPFKVHINDHDLWIVDDADDQNIPASLAAIPEKGDAPRWLLMHRPILSPGVLNLTKPPVSVPSYISKEGRISMILAGHFHLLSLNSLPKGQPPELIIGNAGTQLDVKEPPFADVPGVTRATAQGFGFVTMQEAKNGRWNVTIRDQDGKSLRTCEIRERSGKKTTLRCH